jgi:hypothetical protein
MVRVIAEADCIGKIPVDQWFPNNIRGKIRIRQKNSYLFAEKVATTAVNLKVLKALKGKRPPRHQSVRNQMR